MLTIMVLLLFGWFSFMELFSIDQGNLLLSLPRSFKFPYKFHGLTVIYVIIKITISSILIGLKNIYFPLAKLLSDRLLLDSLSLDS